MQRSTIDRPATLIILRTTTTLGFVARSASAWLRLRVIDMPDTHSLSTLRTLKNRADVTMIPQ